MVLDRGALQGTRKSDRWWSFTVAAGTKELKVVLSEEQNGYQMADLFVNYGTQATIPDQDRVAYIPSNWKATCASVESNRATETCTIANPTPGTWYVHVYGYHEYYGANLRITTSR